MNLSSLIGERLKAERVRIGLKQSEIAEKIGVSREMWGKYERGVAIPGGEVLFSFAAAGADIHYLATGERSFGISSLHEIEASKIKEKSLVVGDHQPDYLDSEDDERRLINLFRSASPEQRSVVIKTLELFLKK